MRTCSGSPPALDQPLGGDHVLHPEQQQGLGGHAVAAGTPGLLVVPLDVLRHVVMDDEADVGLVDPHAERDRGDDDVDLVALERLLHAGALGGRQPGVVGGRAHAGGGEAGGDLLGTPPRQAVDDPGVVRGVRAGRRGAARGPSSSRPPSSGCWAGRSRRRTVPRRRARACRSRPRVSVSSAVAVRAISGTPGNSSRRLPRATYSGRKSCPHWLTQCASSTANSASGIVRRRSRNASVISRSGAT